MPYGGVYGARNIRIVNAGVLNPGDRFRVPGGSQHFVVIKKLYAGIIAVPEDPLEKIDEELILSAGIVRHSYYANEIRQFSEYLPLWETSWSQIKSGVDGLEILDDIVVWKIYKKEREEKGMEREVKKPDYKERMLREYHEVKDRYVNLHKMLVKHDAGKLGFQLNCPVELLKMQKKAMGQYLYILEVRAEIEGIDLRRLPVGRE